MLSREVIGLSVYLFIYWINPTTTIKQILNVLDQCEGCVFNIIFLNNLIYADM